ncbi:hypothetical protein GH714_006949 [Hevea brasiliensis]|uniref:Syringolide-induced protein 14-1-1 n=1 Tax=Hevea brasiliensis TaxID=3981 RepID=A0A6A6LBR9_HEVBR|nr:hypothetical protein GH714_006949 [Hevea brasiliensis]
MGASTPKNPRRLKFPAWVKSNTKKMVSNCKPKKASPPQETKAAPAPSPREIKKHASTIKRLFTSAKKTERRRSDASVYDKQPPSDRAPSLSQMKRFASGRDTFANFDWTAQIAPVDSDHRDYYSDEGDRINSDEEDEEGVFMLCTPPTQQQELHITLKIG